MMIKDEYYIIGLMSGTSCDGVDAALCHFFLSDNIWKYEICSSFTKSYTTDIENRLKNVSQADANEIAQLDVILGRMYGDLALSIKKASSVQIDFIASHGHTVFHRPELGYTLQIGSMHHINAVSGLPVVADFRSLDIAFGGQGAPLVPIGDQLLFDEYDVCLNIGGFANLSFEQKGIRKAYDVCAANIFMNRLTNQLNMPYDEGGRLAKTGQLNSKWMQYLDHLDFYKKSPPKSLGIEWCEQHLFHCIPEGVPIEDLLHTFNLHIGRKIAESIENACSNKPSKVLVTGGGAYNDFLMDNIRQYLTPNIKLIIPENELLEFKEALIFAFMGLLSVKGEINCLSSVTGAQKDVCGGVHLGF